MQSLDFRNANVYTCVLDGCADLHNFFCNLSHCIEAALVFQWLDPATATPDQEREIRLSFKSGHPAQFKTTPGSLDKIWSDYGDGEFISCREGLLDSSQTCCRQIYRMHTCKMHLRMRQTITMISENCLCISRTLESLRISIIAFCSTS